MNAIKEDTHATHALHAKLYSLRKEILEMLHEAGSGHTGGSFSVIDIIHILYSSVLTHTPNAPQSPQRDRFVLSAGHLCPALYTVLADQGYFPKKELLTLRKFGSRLQGHPEYGRLPGIENTSGPLGQGYAVAVGKALALQKKQSTSRVYCLASDGEHDEGAVWEAAQLAAHHKLGNLCVIIDRNNIQIDGRTDDIVALQRLKNKYKAFGWKVLDIPGHHYHLIKDALTYFSCNKLGQPFCIIAHTTLGKGVSFMENNPAWHGRVPNKEDLTAALGELTAKEKSYHKQHLLHLNRVRKK